MNSTTAIVNTGNSIGTNSMNCIGDYWQYWPQPWTFTYPTTTFTISASVTLYARCEHCKKTEPSTGYLPAGWSALETGGVKVSCCSMKCVAEYAKAASKK